MPSTTTHVRKFFLRILVSALISVTNLHARADAPEVVAQGFGFVEGTIFVGDELWFVDYDSSSVLRVHNGQVQTVWQENGCGANGLVQVGAAVLVACYNDGTLAKISSDSRLL